MLLLILISAGCKPAEPSEEERTDGDSLPPFDPSSQQSITYLEIEHARHFLESNPEVTIIDVRGQEEFAKAHLPGAINFPYDPKAKKKELDQGLRELTNNETGKIFLIYGSKENYYAIDVAGRLIGDGYQFLFCFRQDSGFEDWIGNKLPVERKVAAK